MTRGKRRAGGSPVSSTQVPLTMRLGFLRDAAEEAGALISVSRAEADAWRKEWRHILRRFCPVGIHPRSAASPRTVHTCRARTLPLAMSLPGTWVRFRPHTGHHATYHLYQILVVVPPGVPLNALLTPEQLAQVERHVILVASTRYVRVLVIQAGARRASGRLRSVLAGELAARAQIIPPPSISDTGRLPDPLPLGSPVSWCWHSCHGEATQHGIVAGYVPADRSILDVLPGFQLPWGLKLVSNQDRYIVKVKGRKPFLSPAAHLVERAFLEEAAS